jgi:hypothetical protein
VPVRSRARCAPATLPAPAAAPRGIPRAVERLRRPVPCGTTRSGNQGRLQTAAEGGADRRSAKNAAKPLNQSREAHHPARPLHAPEGPRSGISGCYDPAMDRVGLRAWVELYERAWRRQTRSSLLTCSHRRRPTRRRRSRSRSAACRRSPRCGRPARARRSSPCAARSSLWRVIPGWRGLGALRRPGTPAVPRPVGGVLRRFRPVPRLRGVAVLAEGHPRRLARGPEAGQPVILPDHAE